ncbi:hypothetical protein RCL1_002726 [Eukaryota sp. TZLM3-RCL]
MFSAATTNQLVLSVVDSITAGRFTVQLANQLTTALSSKKFPSSSLSAVIDQPFVRSLSETQTEVLFRYLTFVLTLFDAEGHDPISFTPFLASTIKHALNVLPTSLPNLQDELTGLITYLLRNDSTFPLFFFTFYCKNRISCPERYFFPFYSSCPMEFFLELINTARVLVHPDLIGSLLYLTLHCCCHALATTSSFLSIFVNSCLSLNFLRNFTAEISFPSDLASNFVAFMSILITESCQYFDVKLVDQVFNVFMKLITSFLEVNSTILSLPPELFAFSQILSSNFPSAFRNFQSQFNLEVVNLIPIPLNFNSDKSLVESRLLLVQSFLDQIQAQISSNLIELPKRKPVNYMISLNFPASTDSKTLLLQNNLLRSHILCNRYHYLQFFLAHNTMQTNSKESDTSSVVNDDEVHESTMEMLLEKEKSRANKALSRIEELEGQISKLKIDKAKLSTVVKAQEQKIIDLECKLVMSGTEVHSPNSPAINFDWIIPPSVEKIESRRQSIVTQQLMYTQDELEAEVRNHMKRSKKLVDERNEIIRLFSDHYSKVQSELDTHKIALKECHELLKQHGLAS